MIWLSLVGFLFAGLSAAYIIRWNGGDRLCMVRPCPSVSMWVRYHAWAAWRC